MKNYISNKKKRMVLYKEMGSKEGYFQEYRILEMKLTYYSRTVVIVKIMVLTK